MDKFRNFGEKIFLLQYRNFTHIAGSKTSKHVFESAFLHNL